MRGRQIDWGSAAGLLQPGAQGHHVDVCTSQKTLLPTNCNMLLTMALNAGDKAYDWFAMLHDDIEPATGWLNTLVSEAEKHGADLLSAVVPIKDTTGVVSTAIARADSDYGQFCRLTLQQVLHPDFPETFGIDEAVVGLARLPEPLRIANAPRSLLFVNTGCMVYRLSHWRPGILFTQEDEIQRVGNRWQIVYQPEDWVFAKRVARHGGKVMATRKVSVVHHGAGAFSSSFAWGLPKDHELA
jgi:hypothetical protein